MCVFPLLLQLALADTYLGSLSLSSFGSRRPLALTMAGSSGCGGPRATPGLGLGCVKTRSRSIAIEEVIRPKPFQSLNAQADSTWRSN
jgi:hypothetical protein